MIRILIVDDEARLVEAFRDQLTEDGMKVFTASGGDEAFSIVKGENIDVAVLDIHLPDIDGVDLLLKVKQMEPSIEVIMLTGYGSIDTAIRSMKLGAYDYLTKPCKMSELSSVIAKAYEKKMLRTKTIVLEEHLHRIEAHNDFIGSGKAMEKVRALISLVAPSDAPVLIVGETGTGKELAARAIHDSSPRSANPFVAINSSTLQETMVESELFGYKKGAFTGAHENKLGLLEIANKGTFFVDEVGDMGLAIQAKLLRVLESGVFIKVGDTKETRVDIRCIFATNKILEEEIERGGFRKDLFFRINTFVIKLPPLRAKREDIPLLLEYFLHKFSRGGKTKRFSREAMELLGTYGWPGNVRELANVVERATLLSSFREVIGAEDLSEWMFKEVTSTKDATTGNNGGMLVSLAELETEYIQRVLSSVGGNKSKAARLLGITRKNLYDKIAANSGEKGTEPKDQ